MIGMNSAFGLRLDSHGNGTWVVSRMPCHCHTNGPGATRIRVNQLTNVVIERRLELKLNKKLQIAKFNRNAVCRWWGSKDPAPLLLE